MALAINTNVASLNAQRNLTMSQTSLATSLQRLSSGLRINSAKDDAAGLAISERMTTQIRGLNQAVRNANDGISLSQTTEGALNEVANNLQRIRELAVQSANGTNSASDRTALNQEVQQRLAEVERIATQTNFNGLKVLDGSYGTSTFQVGANAGETISVNLSQGVRTTQMGQLATATSTVETTVTALSGSGTIKVGNSAAVTIGASVAGTSSGQTVGSAYSKALAINAASVPGLTATAVNNVEFVVGATVGGSAGDTYSLTINGQAIFAATSIASTNVTAQQIADGINANSGTTGVTAAISGTDLRLSAADGRDIIVGQDLSASVTGGISAGAAGSSTVNGVVFRDGQLGTVAQATAFSATAAAVNGGTISLSAQEEVTITGGGADMGFASANVTIAKDTTTISSVDVLTVVNANNTLLRMDAALTTVNSLRATLGAVQNRFESTITNLQTTSENLSASRGRVLDADFAAETANLSRTQILQQAGTAMLAQANALPQQVLQLLQG